MQFTTVLALLAASVAAQGITTAKTDIGAMLKSMDQSKLASIPPPVRAVFVKMPEDAGSVNAADRATIKGCMTDASIDALGKMACKAQDDQITVVIDKKANVGNKNMSSFVSMAMAAGAAAPKAD